MEQDATQKLHKSSRYIQRADQQGDLLRKIHLCCIYLDALNLCSKKEHSFSFHLTMVSLPETQLTREQTQAARLFFLSKDIKQLIRITKNINPRRLRRKELSKHENKVYFLEWAYLFLQTHYFPLWEGRLC